MTVRTPRTTTSVPLPRGIKNNNAIPKNQHIEKTAATRKTDLFSRTSFRIRFSELPVARHRSQLKSNLIPANDSGRASGSSLNRSEEHTSELQSRGHIVCRLLLEKKKCLLPITIL